jgi:hypothetical protein
VRVFVSSTFRDMGAERNELVKRTFLVLRKLCESRGVTWGEVDLRWGITEEQKAEGQVLPICTIDRAQERTSWGSKTQIHDCADSRMRRCCSS